MLGFGIQQKMSTRSVPILKRETEHKTFEWPLNKSKKEDHPTLTGEEMGSSDGRFMPNLCAVVHNF